MSNIVCVLDLARELAEIASETRDPDTAAKLIVLANEMLTAAGHLPSAGGVGSNGGNGETG